MSSASALASSSRLLDASFVRELEALRRRLEIRARSGAAGDHIARRKGSSAEFQEHRAYTAGDDMRRIDWAAYARTGEPVLKLFRAEEDVIARLVCDASLSLDFGEPSKFFVARKMAAAIGYMTLARSERAQLFVGGEGIRAEGSPCRGRGGLPQLLRSLDALEPRGGTNLAKAIDGVVQRSPRPGMLAVISDFFDPGLVTQSLSRAVAAGHDVGLVQIVAPEDVEPPLEGDFDLVDAETGARIEVTMDAAAIEAYTLRFAGLCEELRAWSRRLGATYVRVRTDEPLEDAVRRFVARGID